MDLCPICLDFIGSKKKIRLKCCHLIHANCLKNYIYYNDNDMCLLCPLCKSAINQNDIEIFDVFNIRELYEFIFNIRLVKCNSICNYSLNVNNMCKNRIHPWFNNRCKLHCKIQYNNENDLILNKSLIFLFYFCNRLDNNHKYRIFKLISQIFKYNNNLNICDLRYILIYLIVDIGIKSFIDLYDEIGIYNNFKKKIKLSNK